MSKKKKPAEVKPLVKKPVSFLILLVGSILGGLILSGIIGLIAWQIVRNLTFSVSGLVGAVGVILIGYPIGNILGIFIVKKWLRLEGSLAWSIPACLLGAVSVLGLAELLNINALVTLIGFSIIAPLAGIVGFLLGKNKQKHKTK